MGEIWFVSDLHFGHNNVISYCQRPFTSVEEMDQTLVDNWNKTVAGNYKVYCLGDMAFHNYERISELNGIKFLIPGNHDLERSKKIFPHFQEVCPELHYLKVSKEKRFVLCHYPIESWRREYPMHLHGHSHGTSVKRHNRLDVGVDATRGYRPIHIDEITSLIALRNSTL